MTTPEMSANLTPIQVKAIMWMGRWEQAPLSAMTGWPKRISADMRELENLGYVQWVNTPFGTQKRTLCVAGLILREALARQTTHPPKPPSQGEGGSGDE